MRRFTLAFFAFATLLFAMPAWACGGFFCFQSPVDQSAERILYIVEDAAVTLHIQISYTGEDAQFSWVLPLAKAPAKNADGSYLAVGSDSIFSILEQATSPQFQLQWQNVNNCYYGGNCFAEDAGAGGVPGSGGGGGNGVSVLLKENVGPYEAVVIQGSTGKDVSDWLNANKYVQPASALPLLDAYAKQGNVFLALRLQKDKGAGDLVPIVVKIAEPGPCLPIRLTQIAAAADMPIVAWVLANKRAIPKNFLHVVINDAVIDWLQYGSNYKTVVSKAVDQGSGHAFTTEYAKPTTDLSSNYVTFANPSWNTNALKGISDPGKFLQTMFGQGFSGSTIVRNLIKQYIKKPAKYATVSDQEFYSCLQNGSNYPPCDSYAAEVAKQPFDPASFAADLETLVVKPMKVVQDQFFATRRYLTRLYTTMSPEEMTKDPIFAYNGDLPTVDRVHKASALPICGTTTQAKAVELTFDDGHKLMLPIPQQPNGYCYGGGFGGVVNPQTSTQPLVAAGGQPAKAVEVLDESGPPYEVEPLGPADLVDAQLNSAKIGTPSLTDEFKKSLPKVTWDSSKPVTQGTGGGQGTTGGTDAGSTVASDATSSGSTGSGSTTTSSSCQASTSSSSTGALALLVIACFGLIRRRRLAA